MILLKKESILGYVKMRQLNSKYADLESINLSEPNLT